jgi:DNA-binding LytR/AlgR family response regulator
MNGKSGIEVGRFLRDKLKNETVQIVYISAKTEYAMELFEFRPMNFLVKPINRSQIDKLMDKYLRITGQNEQFFEYKKKTNFFKVPLAEILYFESHNRKVYIQMTDKKDDFYGSMDDVYKIVKGHCFLFIHKSIIVNYRKIKKISYEQVTMIDDTVLPISQSRRSAIKKMCMKIRKGEQ